jgi:hypothetical protein
MGEQQGFRRFGRPLIAIWAVLGSDRQFKVVEGFA